MSRTPGRPPHGPRGGPGLRRAAAEGSTGWRPMGWTGGHLGPCHMVTGAHSGGDLWLLPDALLFTVTVSRGGRPGDLVLTRQEVAQVEVRWWPLTASTIRVVDGAGRHLHRGSVFLPPGEVVRGFTDQGWPAATQGRVPSAPVPPAAAPVTTERDVVRARRGDGVGWIWMTPGAVRVDLRTRRALAEKVAVAWAAERHEVHAVRIVPGRRGAQVHFEAYREGRGIALDAVRPAHLAATLRRLGWPVVAT